MGPTEETRSSEARKLGRWVLAAVLACAALLGGFSLLAVFVWAAGDLPDWLVAVLGGGLALGSTIFAWIVASALSR
jgi:hypothetical protein